MLLDFVFVVLAAGAVIDVWFNGTIFEQLHNLVDAIAEPPAAEIPITDIPNEGSNVQIEVLEPSLVLRLTERYCPQLLAELLTCPYCMSYHVPWILFLLFVVPSMWVDTPWAAFVIKLPVYSLAATRISNLLNDLLPSSARYMR